MGQILGLNAIVTGAITAYSEAEEGSDYLVAKTKKQIARVTVDYRIVDTTTGVQLMADSGAGIPNESLARIFDPFVSSKPGGMGLGLAISRSIVETHGGAIRVENAAHGGAVFRFTLPFAEPSRA
jgi:signal transduction histidine kinase